MKWRGRIEADGLWFPPSVCSSRRLLEHWCEGSRLLWAREGWLLLFPRPQAYLAERLAVLPVLRRHEGWASFPAGRPAPGELVLKWGGELWNHPVAGLKEVELAGLWDHSELDFRKGSPLGEVTGEPELIARPQAKADVREVFTAIPKPAQEQSDYLQRWEREPEAKTSSHPIQGFLDLLGSYFHSKADRNYISRMLSYFERGDWDKALRYAVPLDDSATAISNKLGDILNSLRPRKDLSFTAKLPHRIATGTSFAGMDLLRNVYRNAHQALLREGRIEEAAFVLAELLDDAHGAVDLLEQHGLYEKAAEIATLKGLSASLQVALWFRAGKVEQALQVARCHYVHALAITILEGRDRDAARAFRVVWAQDLARAGQFGEAVLVGWSVRPELPDYDDWLETTLRVGNVEAFHAAALILTSPEVTRQMGLAGYLKRWLDDTSPVTVSTRRKLLNILARSGGRTSDLEIQQWAATTARRVLRQMNSPWPLGDRKTVDFLVTLSEDWYLKVDLPTVKDPPKLQLDRWHQVVEESGRLAIYDAAFLGDGRFLVALGNVGLVVLSAGGARSQQFSLPCHSLAVPLKGGAFLTRSGSRIGCFMDGKARPLCSAALDICADTHDGLAWLVGLGTSLYQIDLSRLLSGEQSGWQALSETKLPNRPRQLVVGAGRLGVLLDKVAHFYRTPEMKLENTRGLDDRAPAVLAAKSGAVLSKRMESWCYKGQALFHRGHPLGVELFENYGVFYSTSEDGFSVCIFEAANPKKQLALALPGSKTAKVRVNEDLAIISDNRGRLLIADLASQRRVGKFFL